MDRRRLDDCGYISVHTTPKVEQLFRDDGFDIPEHPKQGPIKFKGKTVGRADNFSGIVFKDKDFVWKHRRLFEQTPFWYTN